MAVFICKNQVLQVFVEILDVQEDDYVLDLCAKTRGKSTQIASHLKSGYLVSNEIDAKRAQILLSNIERMGVKKCGSN